MGAGCIKPDQPDDCTTPFTSLYEVTATDIDGKEVSFEVFRGRVLLIVNVASR